MTFDAADRPVEGGPEIPLIRDSEDRLRIASPQAETAALKAALKAELDGLQHLAFQTGIYGERLKGLLHLFTRAFCEQEGELSGELLFASVAVAESLRALAANLDDLEEQGSARINAIVARVSL